MKKLIYIFLFLPLLLNGQIAENKTYPFKGYAFQGNGTSNYIQENFYLTGGQAYSFSMETYFSSFAAVNSLFDCGGYTIMDSGILAIITASGKIKIYITNSASILNAETVNSLSTGYNKILITWNGVANSDIKIYVNDTYFETLHINNSWTGNSSLKLQYMKYGHINYSNGNIWNIKIWKSVVTSSEDTGVWNWLPLSEGNQDIAYDVTGNGNYALLYGFNYWTTSTNSYNKNYGVTKVKYNNQSIFVPYTINKTPIYNHSTPIMNSNEKYINYPDTIWNKKYWVK